jgi:hypothetical protein
MESLSLRMDRRGLDCGTVTSRCVRVEIASLSLQALYHKSTSRTCLKKKPIPRLLRKVTSLPWLQAAALPNACKLGWDSVSACAVECFRSFSLLSRS